MNSRDLGNFLCGIACGAAVCAFLMPKSGPENRQIIRTKAKDVVDKAKGVADKLQEGQQAFREGTSDLKATIGRQRTGIMDAVQAGREAYQRATTVAGNAHA